MACTSVPLWIIFFLLHGLSLTLLFLPVMSPHLCFASANVYPNPSLCTLSECFESFNLENAHAYLLPRSQSGLSEISYFPCKCFCVSLLAGRNLLQAPTSRSSICHPSDSANSLEHCSCASRGVDAADGHVLGVAVKQASNGTPYNHSKGGGGHTSPVLTQEMLWLATW